MACGTRGIGALAAVEDIVEAVRALLPVPLAESHRAGLKPDDGPRSPPPPPSVPPANALSNNPPSLAAKRRSMAAALLAFSRARFSEAASAATEGGDVLAAPISPTSLSLIAKVLEVLAVRSALSGRARGESGAAVYDLGAGDGRWLSAFAKRFGVSVCGVELDADRLALAGARVREEGVEDLVELRKGSVFDDVEGLENASVIVMYLFRSAMSKMSTLMSSRTKPVVVVSVGFQLPGFRCEEEVREGEGVRCYVYVIEGTGEGSKIAGG